MISTIHFYKRKPGISHEEFSDYWSNDHANMMRNNRSTLGKYIKRYYQHHIKPTSNPSGAESLPYDGFSQIWCNSYNDFQELFAQPIFEDCIIPDARLFVDMEAVQPLMICESHKIF